jgi:hypothetical protein
MRVAGEIVQQFEFSEDGDIHGSAEGLFEFVEGGDFAAQEGLAQRVWEEGSGSHNVRVPSEANRRIGTITK